MKIASLKFDALPFESLGINNMTSYERAFQVYQVLIACADERRIITYELLGKKIGVPARSLGAFLGRIAKHCEKNGLPPLTILAVQTRSGKLGEGFRSFEHLPQDRERVFNHNWYRLRPLTIEDLKTP